MPLLEADSAARARPEGRAGAVAPRSQPHHTSPGAAAAATRIFQRIGAADAPPYSAPSPAQDPESKAQPRWHAHQRLAESGPELDVTATAGYRGQGAVIPSSGQTSATPPPRPNGCSVSVGSQMPGCFSRHS